MSDQGGKQQLASPALAIPELHRAAPTHPFALCSCPDGKHGLGWWMATGFRDDRYEATAVLDQIVARLNTWPKLLAALQVADDCALWAFARSSNDSARMDAIWRKYPGSPGNGGDFYTWLLNRERVLRAEALGQVVVGRRLI